MTLELHRYFGYGVIKEVEVYSGRWTTSSKWMTPRRWMSAKRCNNIGKLDREVCQQGLIKHDSSRHFSEIWVPKSALQVQGGRGTYINRYKRSKSGAIKSCFFYNIVCQSSQQKVYSGPMRRFLSWSHGHNLLPFPAAEFNKFEAWNHDKALAGSRHLTGDMHWEWALARWRSASPSCRSPQQSQSCCSSCGHQTFILEEGYLPRQLCVLPYSTSPVWLWQRGHFQTSWKWSILDYVLVNCIYLFYYFYLKKQVSIIYISMITLINCLKVSWID